MNDTAHGPDAVEPPGEAKFQIVFEASGVVGVGDGPNALPVPERDEDDQ